MTVPDLSLEGLIAFVEHRIAKLHGLSIGGHDVDCYRAIAERLRSGARPPEVTRGMLKDLLRQVQDGDVSIAFALNRLEAALSVAPGPSIREIREAVIYEAQGLVYEALGTARPPADGWSGFDARVAARLSRPAPQEATDGR